MNAPKEHRENKIGKGIMINRDSRWGKGTSNQITRRSGLRQLAIKAMCSLSDMIFSLLEQLVRGKNMVCDASLQTGHCSQCRAIGNDL